MVIAVQTRLLAEGLPAGYGDFINELLQRLTRQYPQHQFYFLSDRPLNARLLEAPVKPLVVGPPARHPLLWKYWLDVKVPLALKKIKADVFVSLDGLCSLTTSIPQCLLVPELLFSKPAGTYPKSHAFFYKRYTPQFLKKAAIIATLSLPAKNSLVQQYKIAPQKIAVLPPAAQEGFQPLEWEAQAAVKAQYTEGREYFIYTGSLQPREPLVNLLKAFSFFKKRQQSGMKLVLTGGGTAPGSAFADLLKTYKYRHDVVVVPDGPERDRMLLLASAYAFVDPVNEDFAVPVLQALQCRVPVLLARRAGLQEVAGEAALYFDPAQVTDMAHQLMLVYKDETLRSQLIEKGDVLRKNYSWQQSVAALWHCIADAVKP